MLFQLESGLNRASEETRKFFNSNPVFSVVRKDGRLHFIGEDGELKTSRLVKQSGARNEAGEICFVRVETENSTILLVPWRSQK